MVFRCRGCKTYRKSGRGGITMKDYIVEIADENDGFIVLEADSANDAEVKATEMGYDVLYAHEEGEE